MLLKIGKRFELNFDAIGTDGDQVHLFVGAAPTYSPSKIFPNNKKYNCKEDIYEVSKN